MSVFYNMSALNRADLVSPYILMKIILNFHAIIEVNSIFYNKVHFIVKGANVSVQFRIYLLPLIRLCQVN